MKKTLVLKTENFNIFEITDYYDILDYKINWTATKDVQSFSSLQHRGYRIFVIETVSYNINQPFLLIIKSLLDIYCFVNNRNRGVKQVDKDSYLNILKDLTYNKIIK